MPQPTSQPMQPMPQPSMEAQMQASQQPSFQPTQKLAVTLEAQEWNLVFAGLGEMLRVVSTVTDKVRNQLVPPTAAPARSRGNGALHDDDEAETMMSGAFRPQRDA